MLARPDADCVVRKISRAWSVAECRRELCLV